MLNRDEFDILVSEVKTVAQKYYDGAGNKLKTDAEYVEEESKLFSADTLQDAANILSTAAALGTVVPAPNETTVWIATIRYEDNNSDDASGSWLAGAYSSRSQAVDALVDAAASIVKQHDGNFETVSTFGPDETPWQEYVATNTAEKIVEEFYGDEFGFGYYYDNIEVVKVGALTL